jgi:hypothetical protein
MKNAPKELHVRTQPKEPNYQVWFSDWTRRIYANQAPTTIENANGKVDVTESAIEAVCHFLKMWADPFPDGPCERTVEIDGKKYTLSLKEVTS